MNSLTYTLIFCLAILNIASLADASSLHNSNRILKKRTPFHFRRQGPNSGGAFGLINAGDGPTVASQDPASTAPATSPAGTDVTTTTSPTSSATTTTTRRGALVPGLVTPILGGGTDTTSTTSATSTTSTSTSVTSTTSSTSTTSTTSTTSSAVSTTSTQPLSTAPTVTDAPVVVAPPPAMSTTFSTVTGEAAAQESAQAPPPSGATTRFTRNTLIILVAIAGSIGGVALIWTIIRKWKFSPSSSFEDRMNPIDWQPTQDDGFIPHRPRPASHGSFTSADDHHHADNRSYHGPSDLVSDLPPHDLLAPGSNQVGGGYTDMHRGPSPTPPVMSEGIQRGLSINRGGQYDRHHDAYDYNGSRGY